LAKSILTQVSGDKELAEKLTPKYEIGCKRILLMNDFIPMFVNKSNAHLITDSIEEITETGIMTKSSAGQSAVYEVDLIVMATGFHIEDSICGFKTIGKNGTNLREYFDEYPAAFNGITVPNFPNFFMLLGPNTVLAHNSVLFMIECQVTYVMDCLKKMLEFDISAVEVKEEKTWEFRKEMDKISLTRNFTGNCRGWYKNKDGINFILWPSNLVHYWWITRKVNLLRDYWVTINHKD
jgi:cation diffusion facilitator CzcD-associated flavoprotein CzcO